MSKRESQTGRKERSEGPDLQGLGEDLGVSEDLGLTLQEPGSPPVLKEPSVRI